MIKRILIYIVLVTVVLVLIVFFVLRNIKGETNGNEFRTVYIRKTDNRFQLIRNGNPFYIKGAAGNTHFKELAETGGNTIRVYDTINIGNILNEAEKFGLAVIVGIPLPRFNKIHNVYLNEENNKILKKNIELLVRKYKNHPALLMWGLGNEVNYPLVLWKNSFINTYNDLIDIIHREDPNHPVSLALGGISRRENVCIFLFSPHIDLLSINVFGEMYKLKYKLDQISSLFGFHPYFISEFGSDGEWESRVTSWGAPIEHTSAKKSEQINSRYKILTEIPDGRLLGSVVFYWGNKFERTFTWFSLFDNDLKSETIKELEVLWNSQKTKPNLIGLEYMLVDKKGAADNIIFAPGEFKFAELKLNDTITDSHRIKWAIYPEAWVSWANDTTLGDLNPRKPIWSFEDTEKSTITFMTPKIVGPYRLYAYVYDDHGYFATTNTPFYVLDPK